MTSQGNDSFFFTFLQKWRIKLNFIYAYLVKCLFWQQRLANEIFDGSSYINSETVITIFALFIVYNQ